MSEQEIKYKLEIYKTRRLTKRKSRLKKQEQVTRITYRQSIKSRIQKRTMSKHRLADDKETVTMYENNEKNLSKFSVATDVSNFLLAFLWLRLVSN